jgi:hypothetical protein
MRLDCVCSVQIGTVFVVCEEVEVDWTVFVVCEEVEADWTVFVVCEGVGGGLDCVCSVGRGRRWTVFVVCEGVGGGLDCVCSVRRGRRVGLHFTLAHVSMLLNNDHFLRWFGMRLRRKRPGYAENKHFMSYMHLRMLLRVCCACVYLTIPITLPFQLQPSLNSLIA